jgi:membrane protein implicated in regulation of membrane protease activity
MRETICPFFFVVLAVAAPTILGCWWAYWYLEFQNLGLIVGLAPIAVLCWYALKEYKKRQLTNDAGLTYDDRVFNEATLEEYSKLLRAKAERNRG